MSRLPFELMLALRYLRPKRTFVSVITLISVVGVMLGVGVLIIVISVMSGFDRQMRDKILAFNAHMRIFKAGQPMADYEEVMKVVRQTAGVKGVSPFVLGPVLAQKEPRMEGVSAQTPLIRGIDREFEDSVSVLPKSIVEGEYDVRGNGLLVGSSLAAAMRLHVGDKVSIYAPSSFKRFEDSRKEGKEEVILPDEFEVKGIFNVGYYAYDANFIICSLANAQELYGFKNEVQGVAVMLDDPSKAAAVRRELAGKLGYDYIISLWDEDNSDLLDALKVEKNVMFYILFFIVLVAAFGITSALITFVVQKTREIGVLKALGATGTEILTLFLVQSVTVGVTGVILGFGMGMLAVTYRNEFLHTMRRLTGFELFKESIYNFSDLPALIVPSDIAIICGGSLIICVLAGLIPAWSASRLKPVEALRHE